MEWASRGSVTGDKVKGPETERTDIMASITAPAGLGKGLQYRIVFATDGQTMLSTQTTDTTTSLSRRKPPKPDWTKTWAYRSRGWR